jgi:hypothetical protein
MSKTALSSGNSRRSLLRYAATQEDPERRELAEFCILGPLGKLIAALDGNHPYRPLLVAADDALRAAYPGIEPAPSPLEQMRQHGVCPPPVPAGALAVPLWMDRSTTERRLQPE